MTTDDVMEIIKIVWAQQEEYVELRDGTQMYGVPYKDTFMNEVRRRLTNLEEADRLQEMEDDLRSYDA